MGSPLDAGQGMAETALISTSFAACVIPVAWACAGEMYQLQCDPGAMFEAGQAWLDVAGTMGDAVQANEDLTNSIGGTGWQGADYEAVVAKAAHLSQELMVGQVFAYTVGIALITMSVALFVAITIMLVMGLALAANAVAILAAAASIIGDFGPVEALELEAEMYALECESSLMEIAEGLTTMSHVLGGTITALLAGDIATQSALGDSQALSDLGQASVDGLGTITTGLVAALYQGQVGKYMKTPYSSTIIRALGLTDTVTGSTIPDRLSKPFDPSRN
jgi:hypothetical protein